MAQVTLPRNPQLGYPTSSHTIAAAALAAQQALQTAWPSEGAGPSNSAIAMAAAAAAATAMGAAAASLSLQQQQQQNGWAAPSGDALRYMGGNSSTALVEHTPMGGEALATAAAFTELQGRHSKLQWEHSALQTACEALQARFDALTEKHTKLETAFEEVRKSEAEQTAEARAERRAGEVKDAFLEHLKQENGEWRSHSINVLELKKEKKDKEPR